MKDELEDQRMKNTLVDVLREIEVKGRVTVHPAVDDWKQNAPASFTCYLAKGYFTHDGRTEFNATSMEAMLEVLNSDRIDVVDNP